MDSRHDEISWVHDGFHMMLDHPEYLGIAFGMIGVGVWWWLRQIFVTQKSLEACRVDVAKAAAAQTAANSSEHDDIRKDMAKNHSEMLKILLDKHAH
jgi:hypothetical protein